MSNENFEVIFAGQLVPGVLLDEVKARVAAIFKTDTTRVAHLFSGNPVVIKKGLDQQMALKYQAAMQSAGAICEIRNLAQPAAVAEAAVKPAASPAPTKKTVVSNASPPPQTAPLRVSADSITAMLASLAPVGSDLNQSKQVIQAPIADLSGLTLAPLGTDLSTPKKMVAAPVPDTGGLSIVKN